MKELDFDLDTDGLLDIQVTPFDAEVNLALIGEAEPRITGDWLDCLMAYCERKRKPKRAKGVLSLYGHYGMRQVAF